MRIADEKAKRPMIRTRRGRVGGGAPGKRRTGIRRGVPPGVCDAPGSKEHFEAKGYILERKGDPDIRHMDVKNVS